MTGLVRKATLFVACCVLVSASAAFAGTPFPGNCTIQAQPLVGPPVATSRVNAICPDPTAIDPANAVDSSLAGVKLLITIKDISGNPVNASAVTLDFSGVTGDFKIETNQAYHAGVVNCAAHTVRNFTNTSGQVTFVVLGGGKLPGAPYHLALSGKVFADTQQLPNISVGAYDLNGDGAVGGPDLGQLASMIFSVAHNQDIGDFNGDGTVSGPDLGLFASAVFSTKTHGPAAAFCP
jgi:hypothetical protein